MLVITEKAMYTYLGEIFRINEMLESIEDLVYNCEKTGKDKVKFAIEVHQELKKLKDDESFYLMTAEQNQRFKAVTKELLDKFFGVPK